MTEAAATQRAHNRPLVWMMQPRVEHYRIPVWDDLIEKGRDAYDFEVVGPLDGGRAFGGDARPYFTHIATNSRKTLGFTMFDWDEAMPLYEQRRPDVIIMSSNPRNRTCWRLPRIVRRHGGATICHSKVHSFSAIPNPVMTPIKRLFYRRFDLALCYGELSRLELLKLGFDDDRIVVAQNTIDTRRIFNDGATIAARGKAVRQAAGVDDKLVMLCVGRMDDVKRHRDLLDAWPKLARLNPNLVLVLVGGGPLLDDIRQRAREVDPNRIIVTGRVPEGDDYAWIGAADMTVYPGAVGLAINQSLAFGKPTIIADEIGADTEIVEHGVTGWRYPRGDLTELVAVARRVLNDDQSTDRITNSARRLMKERVTIDNMVTQFDLAIRRGIDIAHQRKDRAS